VYLRLYEHTGYPSAVPFRVWKDQPLAEVNLGEDVVTTPRSPIAFHPWQIRTLRIG
jgi:hypothetical protein